MIMKGQKRKHQPEDIEDLDRNGAVWERQRQSVFCISLDKYQRGQELPEPSLRRSVLIANTLRQITSQASQAPSAKCANVEVCQPSSTASTLQESDKEGMFPRIAAPNRYSMVTLANSQSTAAKCLLSTSNQSGVSHCSTTRSPASCHSITSNVTSRVGDVDDDWGSMSSDHDFSLSAAISSILTALDSTIDGTSGCNAVPQTAPRTALRSLENLAGSARDPESEAVSGAKHGARGHWGGLEHQEEVCRVMENNVEVMRCSYLGDLAVDDLFQDIDTSLLEREMGSLGVRVSGGGHLAGDELLRYLPPLSTSASCLSSSFSWSSSSGSTPFSSHPSFSLSQSLICLPSFSSFSPSSSASCSLSPPSSSALFGQSHVREVHELEHVMEVLVES